MRKIIYILVAGSLLLTACKSKQNYTSWENVYDAPTTATTPVTVKPATTTTVTPATTVRVQSEAVTVTHGSAEKYCIIVGSFGNVDNATRLMSNLQSDNFAGCCVMQNANKMNRVCCASFATEAEARQKLAEVRNQYADAWLLIRQ